MPERSKDWMNQAEKDIKVTEQLIKNESFEWSCFIAQQAAEKAVKAVFQKLNAVAWGNSVFDLMRVLSKKIEVNEELLNYARSLDKYYLILRKDDKPFMDRITEWSEKIHLDFPIEVFPYNEKELNTPVVQEAIKKGIILFERNYKKIW